MEAQWKEGRGGRGCRRKEVYSVRVLQINESIVSGKFFAGPAVRKETDSEVSPGYQGLVGGSGQFKLFFLYLPPWFLGRQPRVSPASFHFHPPALLQSNQFLISAVKRSMATVTSLGFSANPAVQFFNFKMRRNSFLRTK